MKYKKIKYKKNERKIIAMKYNQVKQAENPSDGWPHWEVVVWTIDQPWIAGNPRKYFYDLNKCLLKNKYH